MTANALSGILWTALVVSLWACLPRLVLRRGPPLKRGLTPVLAAWCALGVLPAAPGLLPGVLEGYPGDSLFTLDPGARAGLVAITLGLALLGVWAAYLLARLMSGRTLRPALRTLGLAANLGVTLGAYTACYLLSPQLFYAYYRTIIPGLPEQWVLRGGAQLDRLASAISLQAGDSIAAHTAGGLFWLLAGFTISIHAVAWPPRRTRAEISPAGAARGPGPDSRAAPGRSRRGGSGSR